MNDNIEFKRIWQDTDFYKLWMCFSNDKISVKTELYTTDSKIDDLYDKIDSLIQNQVTEIFWQNGEKGNDTVPCVSMDMQKDKHGHVLIELYVEIDDGGELSKHNCCFYLSTDLMSLCNFNRRLLRIKERKLGTYIQLAE